MSWSGTGRKLDPVWQYFHVIQKDSRKGRRAKCKKCGHEVEGQVARMKKHLFKCSSSFTNENDSECEGEELPGMLLFYIVLYTIKCIR